MTQVEDKEANVKEEGVEGKNKTVISPLLLLESYHNSKEGIEEDCNKKVYWVLEKNQTRYNEVGFTDVPLLNYFHRYQILKGNIFPF